MAITTVTVANQTDLANLALPFTNVAAAGLNSYVASGPGTYVLSGVSQVLAFTLPTGSQIALGQEVTIKRGDGSRFSINISPQGAPLIDTAPTAAVTNAFGFLTLQWDGANWWIVARG